MQIGRKIDIRCQKPARVVVSITACSSARHSARTPLQKLHGDHRAEQTTQSDPFQRSPFFLFVAHFHALETTTTTVADSIVMARGTLEQKMKDPSTKSAGAMSKDHKVSGHTGYEALTAPQPHKVQTPNIHDLPPQKLANITLVFFDCDGVLTDGRVWVDAQGNETKAFSVVDGHGIAMLRESGVKVGMITRSPSGISTARAQKLNFDLVHTSVANKAARLLQICQTSQLDPMQCAYMGDDLPDLSAFAQVGLRIAPGSARPQVQAAADALTHAPGGNGAVREVCDAIVHARLVHLDDLSKDC